MFRQLVLLAAIASLLAACGIAESGGTGAEARSPEALADSVLDAWIEAAGGPEAWEQVRTARFTVTTVWYDSTGAIRRMRPRRVELRKTERGEEARVERPEAEGLYVQTFAGDTSWATLNDAPLPPDDGAVEEAEYVARDVFYWFGLPFKLRDPGVNRLAHRIRPNGVELAVTFGDTVGMHPGDRYFYYFTDEDPFPEQVHYITQGREEKDRNRTVWTGFDRAGPITYVVSRLWVDTLGHRTKELRVDDVWINPKLPDSLFLAPVR